MTLELSQEQKAAVERLTRDLPDPMPMVGGEVTGLQAEALDGYAYGERMRYDTQGRKWEFYRRAVNDQWQLAVNVSYFGIPLGEGAVPLDVVAGTDGENRMLEMVEFLASDITDVQALAVAYQRAFQSEADQAIAPLVQPATSTDPVQPPDPNAPPSAQTLSA